MTEYEVRSFIRELVSSTEKAAKEKGLEFKATVKKEIPCRLYGDEAELKRRLLDILSNAVNNTETGFVTMSVNYEETDPDMMLLKIRVADTGKGISQEDIEKLTAADRHLQISSVCGKGSIISYTIEQKIISRDAIGDFRADALATDPPKVCQQNGLRAPDARILVVDDTPVNMTMFCGLLKKTQIKIDTATCGRKCLELAAKGRYHIIFIDHLMPDMDGIETLHHLQEDDDSVNVGVPMIALTANAAADAREMYLREGFTDYLAKPVEGAKLEQMIQHYLPQDLILPAGAEAKPADRMTADGNRQPGKTVSQTAQEKREQQDTERIQGSPAAQLRNISGINVDAGIQACGTEEIYLSVVKEFYPPAEKQAALIEQYFQEKDYRNYTIQVHSLKSSARLIGALVLSEQAKQLEACGNAEDQTTIEAETPALLQTYRIYAGQIRQIFEKPEDEAAKPLMEEKRLREALETLNEVAEVFDFDSADLIMETLSKYRMPESFQESYEKLKTFMAEVARDDIIDLIHGYLGREEH
ncbi:MAG: response regulator [bacterium]|nr:response regulator [bacterium]